MSIAPSDVVRRASARAVGVIRARIAIADGPDAMAALLDDLGERIAAERAKHGILTLAERHERIMAEALRSAWERHERIMAEELRRAWPAGGMVDDEGDLVVWTYTPRRLPT